MSTRGSPVAMTSEKAIIKGIAEDNGLYVLSYFPQRGVLKNPEQESYVSRATKILRAFDSLASLCNNGVKLLQSIRFLDCRRERISDHGRKESYRQNSKDRRY